MQTKAVNVCIIFNAINRLKIEVQMRCGISSNFWANESKRDQSKKGIFCTPNSFSTTFFTTRNFAFLQQLLNQILIFEKNGVKLLLNFFKK